MPSDQREKLRPTAFDLVAAALAPALIIGMIASLVFFLVIAFYRGEYDTRLMVILGLFTLATVLIARIAIESGRAHANLFAAPLAIAALLAMFRFVTIPGGFESVAWLLNIGLLALVWFLADRITFDCTLVEEDRESVQGGLLETLGLGRQEAHTAAPAYKPTLNGAAKKRARHNPGVWVLYFALLAFPLFALGQLAIPDLAGRSTAFWLLVTYLGCALGLLTTTSLLSLRRYLRQRGVPMPADITARWLTAGVAIAVALLLACLLLPLPGRSLGLIGLPFEITSPSDLSPSRFGSGNDGQKAEPFGKPQTDAPKGDQQPAAQARRGEPSADENGGDRSEPWNSAQPSQQADDPSQQAQSSDRPSSQSNQQPAQSRQAEQDASDSTDQPPRDSSNEEPSTDRSDADSQPPGQDRDATDARRPQPQSSRSETAPPEPARSSSNFNFAHRLAEFSGSLGEWIKWLTLAVLALIVVLYVLFHPREIAKLWRSLLDLLALLLGGKRIAGEVPVPAGAAAPATRPRFGAFANPFAQNLRGWQTAQVVEHTFAALEAWAAEHGHARHADQTAEEFAKRLTAVVPELARLPTSAAGMLDRVMFAGWQPTTAELAPLRELWRTLESLELLAAR